MGAEHARLLLSEGAKVVIGDVLDDEGHSVARQLGDNAHYLRLDVTQPEQWTSAVAGKTVQRFGHLDVLVNNAGVAGRKTLRKFELERWRHTLDVNLTGIFLGTQAVVDEMIRSGGARSSTSHQSKGLRGAPFAHAYVASKWAVRGLTNREPSNSGATTPRQVSVHPGLIRTPMTATFPTTLVAAPLGRPGEPIGGIQSRPLLGQRRILLFDGLGVRRRRRSHRRHPQERSGLQQPPGSCRPGMRKASRRA